MIVQLSAIIWKYKKPSWLPSLFNDFFLLPISVFFSYPQNSNPLSKACDATRNCFLLAGCWEKMRLCTANLSSGPITGCDGSLGLIDRSHWPFSLGKVERWKRETDGFGSMMIFRKYCWNVAAGSSGVIMYLVLFVISWGSSSLQSHYVCRNMKFDTYSY